jgi:hypothetical protein
MPHAPMPAPAHTPCSPPHLLPPPCRWFALALVPLTAMYFMIQRYYIPSARELQRIESITRSPIYSRFGEALAGAATIR